MHVYINISSSTCTTNDWHYRKQVLKTQHHVNIENYKYYIE